jgi:hypothetical protein
MTSTAITEAHVEAALCLWEQMIEANLNEGKPGYEWAESLHVRWEEFGTVQMRHVCIALAPIADRVWEACRETGEEDHLVPFDWEFIPAFLRRVRFTGRDDQHDFEPIDEAAMVADLLA